MDTSNNIYYASSLSCSSGKCKECDDWMQDNMHRPEGAVRECSCSMGRMTILPTCKKCGNAPCGCTSTERYGYPVSPENDLQVQTVGGFGKNEQKPNWAIKEDNKNRIEELRTEITVLNVIKRIFGR